jgi:hypothetical protein
VGLAILGSESETCVGSRVQLVGVSISFEKNSYRLPFTPPSLVHRIGPLPAGIDSCSKIKFKIPPFNGKYDHAAYLDWELEVEQKNSCHDIAATSQVKTAISKFTNFALFWWREYKNKNPTVVPTTWEQLKTAM